MTESMTLKAVILMFFSFLFSITLWDIFLRDLLLHENASITDVGVSYLAPTLIAVILFLFLLKRFTKESSES